MATIEEQRRKFEKAGLGPFRIDNPRPPLPEDVVYLELDPVNHWKGHTLGRWLTCMDVNDLIMGQRRRNDPEVRLVLRGRIPLPSVDGSVPVVLVAPFLRATEADHIDLLDLLIEDQNPAVLIGHLADLDHGGDGSGCVRPACSWEPGTIGSPAVR